jgi:glutamate synthase (ferredoxin)
MSKMGISAVQSYHGAQVFEAVGLRQDVIDEYFTGTASRVGGVGIDVIAREVLMRHTAAFAERKRAMQTELPSGGQYQYRADGEFHLFNPESIHRLQKSVRTGSYPKDATPSYRRSREEPFHPARRRLISAGRVISIDEVNRSKAP